MENKKVIIIGGGFGGLAAAKSLAGTELDVLLIDRTNHHLFQPLLYQVATATVSPANIAQPLRFILRNAKNTRVMWSEVTGIDVNTRTVMTPDGSFAYDFLIVAAGARHSYFGKPEWEQYAPGLKTLEDAVELRRRILTAFELAEKARTAEERQAALTFVIIGGGPTGVEMAGAIAEVAHTTLRRDFRSIDPRDAKVILVDAAPRVLPMFVEELSASAYDALSELGVDVRVNTMVKNLDATGVELPTGYIPAKTIVWAAGNAASPLGKMLGTPTDRPGRVMVSEDLSIPGHPEVFAIGDMCNFVQNGHPVPGVSPAAMQMGAYVADAIKTTLAGGTRRPFKYFDKGSMATIGRNLAVADLHFVKLTGFPAWLIWLFVHLAFIVGMRNKFLIFMQWIYTYLTYGKAARLITGPFKPGQS